jgi:hypothetical protein
LRAAEKLSTQGKSNTFAPLRQGDLLRPVRGAGVQDDHLVGQPGGALQAVGDVVLLVLDDDAQGHRLPPPRRAADAQEVGEDVAAGGEGGQQFRGGDRADGAGVLAEVVQAEAEALQVVEEAGRAAAGAGQAVRPELAEQTHIVTARQQVAHAGHG